MSCCTRSGEFLGRGSGATASLPHHAFAVLLLLGWPCCVGVRVESIQKSLVIPDWERWFVKVLKHGFVRTDLSFVQGIQKLGFGDAWASCHVRSARQRELHIGYLNIKGLNVARRSRAKGLAPRLNVLVRDEELGWAGDWVLQPSFNPRRRDAPSAARVDGGEDSRGSDGRLDHEEGLPHPHDSHGHSGQMN